MNKVGRRQFLELSAAVTAMVLAGCGGTDGINGTTSSGSGGAGGSGSGSGTGTGTGTGTGSGSGSGSGGAGGGPIAGGYPVGIAGYESAALRGAAVRAAIDLVGGIPWLKHGDTVLIKVAHNSQHAYPATSSPVAVAEMVKLLLAAGAGRVYVADLMGIDNTIVPGGWALEDPFGSGFDPNTDGTIRAFKNSGLWQAVEDAVGASEIGPSGRVHITSFREDGWKRYESAADTIGSPRLVSSWVRDQLDHGEHWDGTPVFQPFIPRVFDDSGEVPGMWVPNLVADVDHIVNLHRISTHVMSLFSLALKSWVGIMRPDDRVWMHQISYLKNDRATGDDPIRNEPPYNEILAELHLSTFRKERLMLADASQIIASGGPDASDKSLYPAQLVVAAGDLISADVVGLSIIRMAVMASQIAGGLGGVCSSVPQSGASLVTAFLGGQIIPWHPASEYGTDPKLCNPYFSHWDWIAVQRAREQMMGCPSPDKLDLRFATDPSFAVPDAQKQWLEHDTKIAPTT